MLPNKDEKIAEKVIRVTMITLVLAMISSFYISKTEATDIAQDKQATTQTLLTKNSLNNSQRVQE
ncbi:MAG: hypothetical protein DRQ44_15725 [Gammaproteobacteria bacterium]|nr:MAG: hypothetical protein DRQ44_15725 [Gammaproteobacteria bacterium]